MSHIFISYSRVDLTFVERLAADLKSAGLDVWYDVSNQLYNLGYEKISVE